MNRIIYFDLDGVLADYELAVHNLYGVDLNMLTPDEYKHSDLKQEVMNNDQFFVNLPLMEGAEEMMDTALGLSTVEILSATGRTNVDAIRNQKRIWAQKHFPGIKVNLVERSHEKADHYVKPGHILVDDRYEKAIAPWINKGGDGIHHTSAESTISQLVDRFK